MRNHGILGIHGKIRQRIYLVAHSLGESVRYPVGFIFRVFCGFCGRPFLVLAAPLTEDLRIASVKLRESLNVERGNEWGLKTIVLSAVTWWEIEVI